MKKTDAYPKSIIDRLSRAEGQVRALKQRLEHGEEQDCKEFITQIRAARSALRGVSEAFILKYLHTCESLPPKERQKSIDEAVKLLSSD